MNCFNRRTAIVGAIAAISGCSTQSINSPAHAAQSTGTGIAIVSVTMSTDKRPGPKAIFYLDSARNDPGFLFKQQLVESRREIFGFPAGSDFEDLDGQVHILQMTAGRHSLDSWALVGGSYIGPSPRPSPIWFDVTEGQTAYIGNLHIEITAVEGPLFRRDLGSLSVEIRDRRTVDLPVAQRKLGERGQKISIQLLPLGPYGNMSEGTRSAPAPTPPYIPSPPKK